MSYDNQSDDGRSRCVNCGNDADQTYTLYMNESDVMLEGRLICNSCIGEFYDTGWIDVNENEEVV